MSQLVSANDIGVRFKAVHALNGVSLTVSAGEKVALLGHNGAGKTTLFRCVLGFISPAEGSLEIAGHAPGSRAARRIVSYLPEQVAFPKVLTGREIVAFYARLKGAPRDDIQSVLKKVDLVEAADRRVDTYSKGMRQRLGLAQALVGTPQLLLLDEPTSGLDPISREHFYDLIRQVAARGSAVLLSSHGLSELEARTDRVAILRKGHLVADGALARLQKRANLPIRIRIKAAADAVDRVHAQMGGTRLNCASVEVMCSISEKMHTLATINALGAQVEDVDVAPPTLDEIYRFYSSTDRHGIDRESRS